MDGQLAPNDAQVNTETPESLAAEDHKEFIGSQLATFVGGFNGVVRSGHVDSQDHSDDLVIGVEFEDGRRYYVVVQDA